MKRFEDDDVLTPEKMSVIDEALAHPALELRLNLPKGDEDAPYMLRLDGQAVLRGNDVEGWMIEALMLAKNRIEAAIAVISQKLLLREVARSREQRRVAADCKTEVEAAIQELKELKELKES